MKQAIILTVIITAGIAGVIGFSCGALLTRTDRLKVENKIQSIQKNADEKIRIKTQRFDISAEKLNEATLTIIDLKSKLKDCNDGSVKGWATAIFLQRELQKCKGEPNSIDDRVKITKGFEYKNIHFYKNNYDEIIMVGEMINTRSKIYQMVNFSISLYDINGVLLNVESVMIGRFEGGQTRPFKITLNKLEVEIADYKIDFDSAI